MGEQSKADGRAKARAKERRKVKRVRVEISGKVFVPSTGYEAACQIINLSPAGSEISGDLAELPDARVVLYAEGFGRFEGRVVWREEGRYGVEFKSTPRKQARTAELLAHMNDGTSEQSVWQKPKDAPKGLSQFTRDNGTIVACTVLDISTTGVSLATNVRPQIGELVLIGGMVGCVARHHENGIAIDFIAGGGREMNVKQLQGLLDEWATPQNTTDEPHND